MKLIVGDKCLGMLEAVGEVFPDAKYQRCVVHFYRNVFSVVPKSKVKYGRKPPLSQNLGIRPSELIIDPYAAGFEYHDGDVFLICSDGLTDMVSQDEIAAILRETDYEESANSLLKKAPENGGKDNITIILCKVCKACKDKPTLFRRWIGI